MGWTWIAIALFPASIIVYVNVIASLVKWYRTYRWQRHWQPADFIYAPPNNNAVGYKMSLGSSLGDGAGELKLSADQLRNVSYPLSNIYEHTKGAVVPGCHCPDCEQYFKSLHPSKPVIGEYADKEFPDAH